MKKGSCTLAVLLYVGAFESSFNHVSLLDKFCIMTTSEIIFLIKKHDSLKIPEKNSRFFVSFSNVKTRTHLCVMKKQIRNLPFFFFLSPIIYSPDFTVVFIFMWLFCVWKCGFSLLPIFATIFLNICLISIDLTVVVGTPTTPCLHYSNERRETHKK